MTKAGGVELLPAPPKMIQGLLTSFLLLPPPAEFKPSSAGEAPRPTDLPPPGSGSSRRLGSMVGGRARPRGLLAHPMHRSCTQAGALLPSLSPISHLSPPLHPLRCSMLPTLGILLSLTHHNVSTFPIRGCNLRYNLQLSDAVSAPLLV